MHYNSASKYFRIKNHYTFKKQNKSVIYFNVFSKEKKFCKSKAAEGPAMTEAMGWGKLSSELQQYIDNIFKLINLLKFLDKTNPIIIR